MVIECIVICMDSSDFMRNEDYIPSRMVAQCEAVDLIVQSKLRSNPENHIGIVTLSNNQVAINLTTNVTKLLTEVYKIKYGGPLRLMQGLTVAQLVLKHRPMKTHRGRIIAFVGSPVDVYENDLLTLAKKFKKENISVNVIRFGEEDNGSQVFLKMVETMNGQSSGTNNSTFVCVPRGQSLCEALVTVGVLGNAGVRGLGQPEDEDDEELRMALELSLREAEGPQTAHTGYTTTAAAPLPTGIQDGNNLSQNEQLALALQLSLQEAESKVPTSERKTLPSNSENDNVLEQPDENVNNNNSQPQQNKNSKNNNNSGNENNKTSNSSKKK